MYFENVGIINFDFESMKYTKGYKTGKTNTSETQSVLVQAWHLARGKLM